MIRVVSLVLLFTPGAEAEDDWSVRVKPAPSAAEVPGITGEAECHGLPEPDFCALDALMQDSHAGYVIRVHPDGSRSVSATSAEARAALVRWLATLLAARLERRRPSRT